MPRQLHQPPELAVGSTSDVRDLALFQQDVLNYLERLRVELGQYLPLFYQGSVTFNPSNLADGTGETTTVTVTGARLGDLAQASFSLDLQGILMTVYVSASDVVSVRFQNETGGAVALGSGTLRAAAMRLDLV